jgi:hypothetical protein
MTANEEITSDDAWDEELERRFREFKESGEQGFSWDEVKDLQ